MYKIVFPMKSGSSFLSFNILESKFFEKMRNWGQRYMNIEQVLKTFSTFPLHELFYVLLLQICF